MSRRSGRRCSGGLSSRGNLFGESDLIIHRLRTLGYRRDLGKFTLPDRKADRYSWVEMTTRNRSTGDDCKCDTQSKSETDLKK